MSSLNAKRQPVHPPSVGIVIVSYNASDALCLTLSSLAIAKSDINAKIALVDNASSATERKKIHKIFDNYADSPNKKWNFFQSETNLGFSGGNNIGIEFFLNDEDITHICLLNSDTIVSDYWIDRLVDKNVPIISPVTNKSDSIQYVPTEYKFKICNALDGNLINKHVFATINDFSQRRFNLFKGYMISDEITFFCVLLTKEVVRKVGFLDTAFFPGGFEDDDYCLRARACGFECFNARDVFVHHWGSMSFKLLGHNYFQQHVVKNRQYLEAKHGITWRMRTHKAFSSYRLDLMFLLKRRENAHAGILHRLFRDSLDPLLRYFADDFFSLRTRAVAASGFPSHLLPPPDLEESTRNLPRLWGNLLQDVNKAVACVMQSNFLKQLERDFLYLENCVQETVEASRAIQTWFKQNNPACWSGWHERATKIIGFVRKVGHALLKRQGIIFFGGYFYREREQDGYFQRIAAIDSLFDDTLRIYVDFHARPAYYEVRWITRPAPSTVVFSCTGSRLRLVRIAVCIAVLAIRYRRIYFHSVLAMRWPFFYLLRIPGMRSVMDVHGVVPEEFRYHNDFYSAVRFEKLEGFAIRYARFIIVVTESMGHYLRLKYRECLRGRLASFPILPIVMPESGHTKRNAEKPVVVYAGGLHKWQLLPRMAEAIAKQPNLCLYRIFTPQPEEFRKLLPEHLRDYPTILVDSKSREELMFHYQSCDYGFILRDDCVVNHVACPTKLVEYMAVGIVPIVNCPKIGDFAEKGFRYITLADFERGILPDEKTRRCMASENLVIYERMKAEYNAGIETLRAYVCAPQIYRPQK
ncbi:MAG: glycosyltransferase [Deltaproteobacteria bacterium]|jgi:GT2 family glycosyltransferase|nr:glycosyltransferase [Deltaproteobacteria bacterium]